MKPNPKPLNNLNFLKKIRLVHIYTLEKSRNARKESHKNLGTKVISPLKSNSNIKYKIMIIIMSEL